VAQIETGNDGVTVAEDIDRTFARAVLTAADAVMFSDEAVERAAEALYNVRLNDVSARLVTKAWTDLDEEQRPFFRNDARAVIAALKGDDAVAG
jgi:hypothetical protein